MSDLFQYLRQTGTSRIEVGTVKENKGDGIYVVSNRGRLLSMRSASTKKLRIGDQVIINKTDYNNYIVGTTNKQKNQKEKEVIVDG